jgi:hypothetical protein
LRGRALMRKPSGPVAIIGFIAVVVEHVDAVGRQP